MDKTNYKLGLYEKAMPDFENWEEKLLLTRCCGFDWMEISIDESDKKQSRLTDGMKCWKEIDSAIKSTGVPIYTMCLSGHRKYPFGSRDKTTRIRSLDIMKRAIDFSSYIGINLIQLAGYDVYYEKPSEETAKYFVENLAKAVEFAADSGINMGFETMETPFMDTVEKAMKYVNLINSPYLGVYPDIGNLENAAKLYGTDTVDDIKKGKGHIFAAHLKETRPGVYRDMFFGEGGHTRYDDCISELLNQGVRMFNGEFWYHGEENYADLIKKAASFLRNKIEG